MPLVCTIWGLIQTGWIWTQYHRLNDLALLSARDAAAQVPCLGACARIIRPEIRIPFDFNRLEAGRWRSTLVSDTAEMAGVDGREKGGVPWLSVTQSARSRPIDLSH